MRFFILLLCVLNAPVAMASTVDSSIQAPQPLASNGVIRWQWVLAESINVHKGNGEWLVSLPGDTTSWVATESGDYFLVATDSGDWTGWAMSDTVTVDSLASENELFAVKQLRGDVYSETALEIFWQPPEVGEVDGYLVYRDGELHEFTSGRSYFDQGLSAGRAYVYAVAPLYVEGSKGTLLSVSLQTQGNAETPSTDEYEVMATVSVYSSTAAELFWQRPGEPGNSRRFEVHRDGVYIGETHGSSFFDDSLSAATEYEYEVWGVDGSLHGQVLFSTPDASGSFSQVPEIESPTQIDNQLPTAVSNLSVSVYSETALELFWGVASDADGDAISYQVYRDNVPVASVDGGSYFTTDLIPSTDYVYEVRAVDATGAAGPSAAVNARTLEGYEPPELSEVFVLPADCITARAEDGAGFCFSAETRELLSVNADGSLYWSFALPGSMGENDIRELLAFDDGLLLIAELNASSGTTGYELSKFDFDGAFAYTVPLLANEENFRIVGYSAQALQVLEHKGGLVIVGEYRGTDADVVVGTFVVRVNPETGEAKAVRQFPDRVSSAVPSVVDGVLVLSLDGEVSLFNVVTLESEASSSGLTFNINNYRESKDLALALLQSADFATVDVMIGEVLDAVGAGELEYPVYPGGSSVAYELDCPDGGFVNITGEADGSNYGTRAVLRIYSFVSCIDGNLRFNGEFSEENTFTSQKYNSGGSREIGYKDIWIIGYEPYGLWQVDASRSEVRSTDSYGTLFYTNRSSTAVSIERFYQNRSDGSYVVGGDYSEAFVSTNEYDYQTGGRRNSSSWSKKYSGAVSSVSAVSGLETVVSIDPQVILTDKEQAPSVGQVVIRSTDGSSVVVDVNSGDLVRYSVFDGLTTTVLDSAW